MSAAATAAVVTGPAVRLVLQRVNSAALLVDNISRRVNMSKGVVCHCAFFEGANESHITKAVKLITESKLFAFEFPPPPPSANSTTSDDQKPIPPPPARPKPVSLVEDPSLDLMIVPQASIAGRMKGKMVQYHGQCPKDQALELYTLFILSLRKTLLPPKFCVEGESVVLDLNGELIVVEEKDKTGNDDEESAEGKKSKNEIGGLPRKVLNGTYGNIQALNFDSPGPMTHVLDVDL